jgi:hypothetical protein
MAQLTDQQKTQIKFGIGQLMAHTPKWAKVIITMIGSLLITYNTVLETVPQVTAYIPHNVSTAINLALLSIGAICQMFGLKNPFVSTPDSKDVPVDTAGVTIIKKVTDKE